MKWHETTGGVYELVASDGRVLADLAFDAPANRWRLTIGLQTSLHPDRAGAMHAGERLAGVAELLRAERK